MVQALPHPPSAPAKRPSYGRTVFGQPTRPRVLLIFQLHIPDSAAMIRGIAHFFRANGPWTVLLDDSSHAASNPIHLLNHHWDGVISRHTTPDLVARCLEMRIPFVSLDETSSFAGVPSFRPDHYAIGKLGAEHLLSRKSAHFAFYGIAGVHWAEERKAGFCAAIAAADRRCSVYDEAPTDDTTTLGLPFGNGLRSWLRGLPEETSLMAHDDVSALRVIRAAEAIGRSVPDELAVLGASNDCTRCELGDPPLSSVAANPSLAGQRSAEHLARLMAGDRLPVVDQKVSPIGVVARRSTDICDARDENMRRALAFVRQHACEGISVKSVLQHVRMSRSQLESKFRRYVGRSPQAEIRRLQVQRASQLLIDTNLSVKEIAGQVGFKYVEYMSVVFKRATGEAPGRFRHNFEACERTRTLVS